MARICRIGFWMLETVEAALLVSRFQLKTRVAWKKHVSTLNNCTKAMVSCAKSIGDIEQKLTFHAGGTYKLIHKVHLKIRHFNALGMIPFVASLSPLACFHDDAGVTFYLSQAIITLSSSYFVRQMQYSLSSSSAASSSSLPLASSAFEILSFSGSGSTDARGMTE